MKRIHPATTDGGKPNGRKIKKRAIGAAVGIVASVSVAVSSLFGAPADVIAPEVPAVIVSADAEDADAMQPAAEDKSRRGARVRAWVLRLPTAVRLIVVLPLWFFGKTLTLFLTVLWQALSPLWSAAAGILFNLLLVLGLSVLIFKLLFPDKPLRELFRKKNILAIVVCTLLLTAADHVLPLVWKEYATVSVWVKAALTLVIPIGLFFVIRGKKRSRHAVAA